MNFIKKHKIKFIILLVFVLILVTAIILMFTLFALKSVELEFKTETLNISYDQQEDIKQKTHEYGGSVLFIGKEKIVNDLENQFPYLKIVNIETVFPNKLIIHCAEREELFVINSQNKFYYVDEELKLLKISDINDNTCISLNFEDIILDDSLNPPSYKIVNLDLNLSNAKEGQFIKLINNDGGVFLLNKLEDISKFILTAFEQNNRQIDIVKQQFKEFEIFYKAQKITESSLAWRICLRLVDRNDYEIQIVDCDVVLAEKISVLYDALTYAVSNPEKLEENKLIIYQNENKQIVYQFQNIDG